MAIIMSKINFNIKNKLQWQKSISKINFNGKNQFQLQPEICNLQPEIFQSAI
jgi:hypothetical protein